MFKSRETILSFLCATLLCAPAYAQSDPNPAVNHPDQVSWELFVKVTAPAASAGNNNVLFETWASDGDTFQPNPRWPGATPSPMRLRAPILSAFGPRAPGPQPHVLPGGSEETRRNKVTFDFIVNNKLFMQDDLKRAFTAGNPIVFPVDSIEVKAVWKPVDASTTPDRYHINTASDGQRFALISMHVISKLIPNWTWATFEHEDNLGRCDFIGCHDQFGAEVKNVLPLPQPDRKYPACAKTPALLAMFTAGNLAPAWRHYCLKGSQVDFTTSTGLPTLLGNSNIEPGFVNTSSCMTCHGRAAFDANGRPTSQAGFLVPPPTALCPTGAPCSPNGTPDPAWFWQNPGKPNQSMIALQTDFVWAIPLCALRSGSTQGVC